MALDMLLAEKGGVCHMFGDLSCCSSNRCNRLDILVTCGCCCIKKDMTPPPYSMPLLSAYQSHESDDDDEENDV